MGLAHSSDCWGEPSAGPSCEVDSRSCLDFSHKEADSQALWAPMPVTAIAVLESDRIDPWSQPRMLRAGRRKFVQGRHEEVVADTMGPEVVVMHSKGGGAAETGGPAPRPAGRRAAPCRSREALSIANKAAYNGAYNMEKSIGLAGLATKWDLDDESASGSEEGDCELQLPIWEQGARRPAAPRAPCGRLSGCIEQPRLDAEGDKAAEARDPKEATEEVSI